MRQKVETQVGGKAIGKVAGVRRTRSSAFSSEVLRYGFTLAIVAIVAGVTLAYAYITHNHSPAEMLLQSLGGAVCVLLGKVFK